MRDREGIVQVVVAPEQKEAFAKAESVRSEFVLASQRYSSTIDQKGLLILILLPGEIEVAASELTILNRSEPLPFPIDDEYHDVGEETRLRYRYLDIRRPEMLEPA